MRYLTGRLCDRRVRADVTRKVHAVFCDFARPSKARKTVAKAAVSMPRRGGNEVWDDLGFDPTEAERRKGNRAKTVWYFSYFLYSVPPA